MKKRKLRVVWLVNYDVDFVIRGGNTWDRCFRSKEQAAFYGKPIKFIEADRKG